MGINIGNIAKGLLGVIAPTIATAAVGPMGGIAAHKIMSSLGIDSSAPDAETQLDTILQNPTSEQMAAIRQSDNELKIELGKQGIDLERINAADRDSARSREIQTGDNTNKILAAIVTVGFFGVLATMMFIDLTGRSETIINIMVGALGVNFTGVMQYYFGSSKGSKDKTKHLANRQ